MKDITDVIYGILRQHINEVAEIINIEMIVEILNTADDARRKNPDVQNEEIALIFIKKINKNFESQ